MDKRTAFSVNLAMTIDGRTELPGGGWSGLSSKFDRRRMDQIRRNHEALFVGERTVRLDAPILAARDESGNVLEDSPFPVILCRSRLPSLDSRTFLHLPRGALLTGPPLKQFSLDKTMLESFYSRIFEATNDPDRILELTAGSMLEQRIVYFEMDPARLDPVSYSELAGALGLRSVLIEGGPGLVRAFAKHDLIDRFFLTITPFLMGDPGAAGILGEGPALDQFQAKKWKPLSAQITGEEVFLEYVRLREPWSS